MDITIPLEGGYLPDRFGKFSDESLRKDGNSIHSFPFSIEGVPENAVSLAWAFIDYDSTPVCGFTWIHWIACGAPASYKDVPEGASHSGDAPFIQGSNSCVSRAAETSEDVIRGYIGPCPPDKDHRYTLMVYALDTDLGLEEGFYFNELHWAIQGHILASAEVNVMSRA